MRNYIGYILLSSVVVILFIWVLNLKRHSDKEVSKKQVRDSILYEMNDSPELFSNKLLDSLKYQRWIVLANEMEDSTLVLLLKNLKSLVNSQGSSSQPFVAPKNGTPYQSSLTPQRSEFSQNSDLHNKDSLEQVAAWLAMKNQLAESELEKFRKTSDSLLQLLASKEKQTGVLYFNSPQGVKIQYVGEIKNGKANGFGMGIWETGHKYEGYWEDGLKEGLGIYRFANGEVYHGIFISNKREGKGVYFFKNGDRYSGDWKQDIRDGVGAIFSKSEKIKKAGVWNKDKLVQNKRLEFDEEQELRSILRELKGR